MTRWPDPQQQWYAENIILRQQVVADVGAQVGALSQFFWEAGEGTSQVVSIEPIEENARAIESRIVECGAENWRVERCAVSDHTGSVALRVAAEPHGGFGAVVTSRSGPQTRTAPARRLSELVPDATVVKLDIEGHEYRVLDEALPRLGAVHTWAIEFHMVADRPLERALAGLEGHGYRLFAAGRKPDAPQGAWIAAPIPAALDWSKIPVAMTRPDGSVFKMLHVLARRDPS